MSRVISDDGRLYKTVDADGCRHVWDRESGKMTVSIKPKAGRRQRGSDLERKKFWVKSGYYKSFGKRAGRRLQRRTGKNPRICREAKHLP